MLVTIDEPFNLAATLESGQAFRWHKAGDVYQGVVFGNVIEIRGVPRGIEFSCLPDAENDIAPLLCDYLGLNIDLASVYEAISVDKHIEEAITRYSGMRVLRQDPWECLVGFICSSASNIPRISRNVEDISIAFGKPIGRSIKRHSFPTPEDLAEAGEKRIFRLGLGYRATYLSKTAQAVAEGDMDLASLRKDSYGHALEALVTLAGVGDKVANCVLLFSLDKPEAFPVDTWIIRVLREWYLDEAMPNSLPKMRAWAQGYFGPYAGYANQYLFHERRRRDRS
jgi:N-glycosylase/DNA lyase